VAKTASSLFARRPTSLRTAGCNINDIARSVRQRPLELRRRARDHGRMLAAAVTVWVLFSLWLIAPLLHLPRSVARVAGVLLWAELAALLIYSYGSEGCSEATCAPLAQAAGIAARTDVPILTAAFVAIAGVLLARRGRVSGAP
jgi:hypothetical protein